MMKLRQHPPPEPEPPAPVHTVNRIRIRAPWRAVFEAAQRVEDWPRLLPHYRWVRVSGPPGEGSRRVEMAAHRDGLPCRWTAEQRASPGERSIFYRHVRSRFTLGMEVAWVLTPAGDAEAETEVALTHDLASGTGWKGWFRRRVVGEFFVRAIADRTLAGLKRHLEVP